MFARVCLFVHLVGDTGDGGSLATRRWKLYSGVQPQLRLDQRRTGPQSTRRGSKNLMTSFGAQQEYARGRGCVVATLVYELPHRPSPRVPGRLPADPCQQESSEFHVGSNELEHETTCVLALWTLAFV